MTKKELANRFKEKKTIRIAFVGNLDLSKGSDRIFSYYFCNHLNEINNVNAVLVDEFSKNNFDILILKKSFSLKKLIEIRKYNKNLVIGIINPSDKRIDVLLSAI